uniref:SPRY domain-containing protein n=1 Tax=Oryza punctata TaxID=4537 RepID=A0A0E0KVQ6_ORYPU
MASPEEEAARSPPPKRPRRDAPPDPPEPQPARVGLNPADCDLDFDVSGGGGLRGEALHDGGFAYCWSGARATVGVRGGGKYCFGCKVVAEQAVEMEDTAADQQHLCRVGVSRGGDPVGALGETGHSFGFGGTGKFSHHGKFVEYGVKFGVGDTVVCAVDLDSKPLASIGFSRNGEWLGIAKHFDASDKGLGLVESPVSPMQWESAMFPHVLLKNVVVEMQFSKEDGLQLVDGYEPWPSACVDGNVVSGPVFAEQKECAVMMMVGLPASGKSTWAEKWIKEHKEKRFILLGTNLALEQMKVPGLLRKNNYGERFERLMDRATMIFNTLLTRAAKIPRNYIIDQTNVFKNARSRKLRPFANYRKTAVVVFPSPSELKARAAKRFKEMGKDVPADAVNEMTANFVLPLSKDMPDSKEPFDEVIFVELSRDEAQRNLYEMIRLLPRASTPSYANFSNQNVSSTYNGTIAGTMPPLSSGYHRQMDSPYGSGVQTPRALTHQQAAWGVQSFQSPAGINHHQIHLSYPNTPYQHQIQSSHPSTPYQHQAQSSSYPSTPYQDQIHTSYPSNPNQHQIHPNYPSTPNQYQSHSTYPNTPFPGHGNSTYGSNGGPGPYNPNPYNMNTDMQQSILAPICDMNQSHTLASNQAYGRSGYEAANSVGRPINAHPSTPAVYSSGNYMPYMQHSHNVHNSGSQYSAPVPRPPYGAPPPNNMNPQASIWYI